MLKNQTYRTNLCQRTELICMEKRVLLNTKTLPQTGFSSCNKKKFYST